MKKGQKKKEFVLEYEDGIRMHVFSFQSAENVFKSACKFAEDHGIVAPTDCWEVKHERI